VELGEEIEVILKMRSLQSYQRNLAVVDLLPAGFEVVMEGGVSAGPGGRFGGVDESNWTPEYADVREDRVVLYGGLDTGVSKFVYRIKA
jgi:hypothetical protein